MRKYYLIPKGTMVVLYDNSRNFSELPTEVDCILSDNKINLLPSTKRFYVKFEEYEIYFNMSDLIDAGP